MSHERRKRRVQRREARREEISIAREVDYIVARAVAQETRIVTLRRLVFFATSTGDAWLLDAEDGWAMRLAQDGMRMPVAITEIRERFAIDWPGTFRIEETVMVFTNRLGESQMIFGYPVREIVAALERARS